VADHLSFTRAAIALDLSQSHVTTQIQKLESYLDSALFRRRGRAIELTERGKRLMSYARRLINLAREAEDSVKDRSTKALTIAAHESLAIYRLPEVLNHLRKISPDTLLRVAAIDDGRVSKAARDGMVDLAFVYTTRDDCDTNAIVLGGVRPVVVCSKHLPMSSTLQLSIADIRRFDGLVCSGPCPTRVSYESMLAEAGISDARLRDFPSIEAIKRCALHGLGYAVLPRDSVIAEIDRGELFEIQPPIEIENIFATLVVAPGRSSELNAVIQATRAVYTADPACGNLRSA